MSYCRANGVDSDVYVVQTMDDNWRCYACRITPDGYGWWDSPSFDNRKRLVYHLTEHLNQSQMVPQRCFDRLLEEMADE